MKRIFAFVSICLLVFSGQVFATTYTETYSEPATGVRKISRKVVDYANTSGAIVVRDVSGNFAGGTFVGDVTGDITGTVTGDITGNIVADDTAAVVTSGASVAASSVACGTAAITTMTGNVTGNCSGTAASITGSLTGDVTSTGMVTTIAATSVESSMLASGAGVAAVLTAGLGNSASYTKVTTGAQTLNVSDVAARVVIGMVIIDEVFANGNGDQPTFSIGETDSLTKFAATSVFTDAANGAVFTFAGTLTATKALVITATAGTGTTETGAMSVTTLILDAE